MHDITYINVPGYETVRTYDRSNRVVREEYYDLFGNPLLHAEGYYAKTMEYERYGYVAREYYYGLDGELITDGVARQDYIYDYDGLLLNRVYYDSSGQILAEIEDSYFLRDLEGYRQNADYVVFLAVQDEAASGINRRAERFLKKHGLPELADLETRGSYLAVIQGQAVLYEARGSREQLLSYESNNYAIKSAGYEAGNIASIVIDGQEYSKHGRGINMVVYDTVTREVVYSGVYDTWQYQMQVP